MRKHKQKISEKAKNYRATEHNSSEIS